MAVRRSVAVALDLRWHLADRMRSLIDDYEHVPEATRHWGRELERIEAGDEFTFYGWEARGCGAPVHVHGRYRLTSDDQIVPDRPGAGRGPGSLLPESPRAAGTSPHRKRGRNGG